MNRKLGIKKIAIIAASFLLLLGACSSKKSETLTLTSQEVLDKLENKESFVVYFGTTTCPACIAYKPVVSEMMKSYDVKIYSVMLDKEKSEDAKAKLFEVVPIEVTPTTFIVIDGEIKTNYEGVMEYRNLKSLLVEYGFIK